PTHGSDAGCFLLAECFGCKTLTLVKDVDGLYDRDPKTASNANFISEISVTEFKKREFPSLPFEPILIDLLAQAKLIDRFQIVNGTQPELLASALNGDRVGTMIYKD
ncbi:MAG: uridylate kinase, partial [Spirulina sp.]